jgi:hypothetical protein
MLQAGNIASWESPKDEVLFSDLRTALDINGFDEELAKELAPRNAFSRACKQMCEDRVIDKVEETDKQIKFQLTKKALVGTELEYTKECDLFLDKESGRVDGSNEQLAKHAEALVIHHQNVRCSADITRLIQKIFQTAGGDLVPLRKQGGVYFVPHTHTDLIHRIGSLMAAIGGTLNLFAVDAGDEKTKESVANQMTDHLLALIGDFKNSCRGISADTATSTLERRVETAQQIRGKLESYQSLLSGYASKISTEIEDAEREFIEAAMRKTAAA